MPFAGCAIAIPIVSQCSIHTKNCIRKQAGYNADFAEIIMIYPLVISIAHLFYISLFNQLLQLAIKDICFLKVLRSNHAAMFIKDFLALFDIHSNNPLHYFLHDWLFEQMNLCISIIDARTNSVNTTFYIFAHTSRRSCACHCAISHFCFTNKFSSNNQKIQSHFYIGFRWYRSHFYVFSYLTQ